MTRSHAAPYIYPDVDWQRLMFRDFNMNQRANINIQGGGNRATYYMSLNFNHDSGIVNAPKDYYFDNNIRNFSYNFQNNISYKLSRSTVLDLHLNAQLGSTRGPAEGASKLFEYMLSANPIQFPAYYPSMPGDTHIRFGNASYKGDELYTNPYAAMLDDQAQYNYTTLNVSLKLDQKLDFITKGLAIQGLANWKSFANKVYRQGINPTYYTVKPNSWSPDNPNWFETQTVGPLGDEYVWEDWTNGSDPNSDQTFYFDARLTYNRAFNRHNVGALLMYMMREYRPGKDVNKEKYVQRLQRNQGLSGRVTYDFDQRYFAEFNFGYNGTERLPEGDRFEFFPAVSVGWAVSNEKFWEPLRDYVDFLKIRGSYGIVGSDGFDDAGGTRHFVYFDQIVIGGGGGYNSGPSPSQQYWSVGPAVNGYASSNVHWERVKKLDIGVDLSLFRQVNITFDYFKDKRDRIMMMRANWPEIFGYFNAIPWGQVGKAENEGYEFSINWHKDFNRDWSIDLRSSFTYTKNKFIDKDEPNYTYPWQYKQGLPMDGYRCDGYGRRRSFQERRGDRQQPGTTVRFHAAAGRYQIPRPERRRQDHSGRHDVDLGIRLASPYSVRCGHDAALASMGFGCILQRVRQPDDHGRQRHCAVRRTEPQSDAVYRRQPLVGRQPRSQRKISASGRIACRFNQQHGSQHLLAAQRTFHPVQNARTGLQLQIRPRLRQRRQPGRLESVRPLGPRIELVHLSFAADIYARRPAEVLTT